MKIFLKSSLNKNVEEVTLKEPNRGRGYNQFVEEQTKDLQPPVVVRMTTDFRPPPVPKYIKLKKRDV